MKTEYPDFLQRYTHYLEMINGTVAERNYLSAQVEELEGELENCQRRVADLEAQNRALKGQLAALHQDKEMGEVLPS